MIISMIIIRRTLSFLIRKGLFLLPSVLGDTRRETQFIRAYVNHTMLTPQPNSARRILWCPRSQLVSAGRDRNWSDLIRSEKLNHYLQRSNHNWSLFQNSQIIRIITSSYDVNHHSVHSSPISCEGVYYDRWGLSYPFRTGGRVPVWPWHLNQRHRVVQSLTKLKNKILLTKNY